MLVVGRVRARTDARGRVVLGWRDAHDYIASTLFDLVSLAWGLQGPRSQHEVSMEHGIFIDFTLYM